MITDDTIFEGRLDDIISAADDGIPSSGDFLDPAQQYFASAYVKKRRRSCSVIFYGGYGGAERRIMFALPDYFGQSGDEPNDVTSEYIAGVMTSVYIRGSGYEKLSHPSFLGALMSLGIDRSRTGDIIVLNESSAYLFCELPIANFLTSSEQPLTSVGRDRVTVEMKPFPADFIPERKTELIRDTIASSRLDCVVSALTGLSRERADEAIKSGIVTHNYIIVQSRTAEVKENDTLSIRGYGKYRISSIGDPTRKDRLRLVAEKSK